MGDTIGLCPPLIIKPHEVDEMLGLFAQTLKTVEAKLPHRA
jgi:4-aminobutyrate--pyruvate transaminase